MVALLVSLLLAQSVAPTPGAVYVWVDAKGEEHFTDSLASIPRGAKVRTTTGEPVSRIDSAKRPQPAQAQASAGQPPAQPEVAAPNQTEEAWRQRFKAARRTIEVLEEEIESDRKKVEEVSGLPINARLTCYAPGSWGAPLPLVGPSTTVVGGGVAVGGQVAPGVGVTGSIGGSTTIVQPAPLLVNPCLNSFNPEFERLRERAERNRRDLVRAREDLADLERRASFASVPLHWRR